MSEQTPSVGRIVHYHEDYAEGKTFAAVIVAVVDDVVNLVAWNEFGKQISVLNVKQGDIQGQWNWPPRI